jgi:hypothetical protein
LICTKESKQIDAETKLLCRNTPENQKTQRLLLLLLLLFLLLLAYQESGSVVFITIQNELDERWRWQLHLIITTTTTSNTSSRRSMMMTRIKKRRIITRLMICKTEICALCASNEIFPISYCFSTIASRLHIYWHCTKREEEEEEEKQEDDHELIS